METTEKAVVRQFYEIVNSGSPERLGEVCSPDLRGHAGAGADLADLKQSVASFLQPFPDLTAEIRHLVQEGDLVSTWVSYTATHRADFAGVPASGRRVKFAAWDLVRVSDGKIVEVTQYCDLFTILSQIGALPTAAPA
ncbi:MAG: ester cyclase [Nocardioides sp.]